MANKPSNTRTITLVMGAILTAIVIVLQFLGSFIHLGPFSISLVLLPIVVGASLCGPIISAWLGFVFGVVVLLSGDATAFMAVNAPGTIITVLLKGALCGLVSGLVYKLLAGKVNSLVSVIAAAVTAPVVNTGVFLIGCKLFFYDTIAEWGAALGYENTVSYMFMGLVGLNFLVELGVNVVLSPTAVKLIEIGRKKIKK